MKRLICLLLFFILPLSGITANTYAQQVEKTIAFGADSTLNVIGSDIGGAERTILDVEGAKTFRSAKATPLIMPNLPT